MGHGIAGVGRVHLIVYSDHVEPFARNAGALCDRALEIGFDTATHHGPDQLSADPFWADHRAILEGGPRAGHGLWKPYLLLRALRAAGPDDVVIYHDAGSQPAGASPPLPRFPTEAIRLAARSRGRFIHGSALEWSAQEHLTRRDCLIGLGADDPALRRAPFVAASPLIYMPSEASFAFLTEWLERCCAPELITDAVDRHGETPPLMRCHMHEEAIGSILVHRHGAAHFDAPRGAPARFQAARRHKRSLRTPEGHLSVLSAMLDQMVAHDEDPSAAVRNLDREQPPVAVPDAVPAPVLRAELAWMLRGARGRICRDHLRIILSGNKIVRARLHGLKDAPHLVDDFWRQAVHHANTLWIARRREGPPIDPSQIDALLLRAVRAVFRDMPLLADEMMAGCVWGRLGDRGRAAFKGAKGGIRSDTGAEAMAEFVRHLNAKDFPVFELELAGDLRQFDDQVARHLMDWLLLEHL